MTKTRATIWIVGLSLIAAEIPALLYYFPRWRCENAWSGSGFDYRWRFGGGCQIKVKGKFVPEDAVNNFRLEQ